MVLQAVETLVWALPLGHYLNLTLLTVTLTNIMKKLLYLFLTVLIVGCSGEDGGNDQDNNNQSSCNGDNPVYLDDNGVTIKA